MNADEYKSYSQEVDGAFASSGSYEQLYLALSRLMEKFNPFAIYEIGRLYEYGNGITQDNTKALAHYVFASYLGLAEAKYRLGMIYEFGRCGVSPPSPQYAAESYREASELGHAGAQCQLGGLYERGHGVEQDESVAAGYYKLAANNGSALGAYLLGDCYLRGLGVRENVTEGLGLLHQAAQLGSGSAQIMLAIRYKHGHQLPRDYVRAYTYAELASKNATSEADRDAAIELRDEVFAKMSDPEKSKVI